MPVTFFDEVDDQTRQRNREPYDPQRNKPQNSKILHAGPLTEYCAATCSTISTNDTATPLQIRENG